MTHPSWVALHIMAHTFIELDKAVVHLIKLVSFLWLWFSVCLPSEGWGLWKLPDGTDWLRGTLGLVLMGGAMASTFFVDGQGCVTSLFLTCGKTMVEIMKIMETSFKWSCVYTACIQCPWPCTRPLLPHASAADSWTLRDKSGSVSCGATACFSSVLVHARVLFVLSKSVFPSPV